MASDQQQLQLLVSDSDGRSNSKEPACALRSMSSSQTDMERRTKQESLPANQDLVIWLDPSSLHTRKLRPRKYSSQISHLSSNENGGINGDGESSETGQSNNSRTEKEIAEDGDYQETDEDETGHKESRQHERTSGSKRKTSRPFSAVTTTTAAMEHRGQSEAGSTPRTSIDQTLIENRETLTELERAQSTRIEQLEGQLKDVKRANKSKSDENLSLKKELYRATVF